MFVECTNVFSQGSEDDGIITEAKYIDNFGSVTIEK